MSKVKTAKDIEVYEFDACYPCQLAAGAAQPDEFDGITRIALKASYEAMANIYPGMIFTVNTDAAPRFDCATCEVCGDHGDQDIFRVTGLK